MVKRMAFLALFLFTGLAIPAVRADEMTGQPLVVLVGIDKYEDAQIKPRKHAEADAKALADVFLAKDRLGADKERVKLLLGSGAGENKATKDNILAALQWIEKTAKKDDLVIFAIFGNGAPLGDRTCYFGVDSTFKDRGKDAIAADDVEHIFNKIRSQRVASFVDVHYLGFDIGKEKLPDLNTANIFKVFLSQGDESKDESPSRVLFIAGQAAKLSLDLEKHGIFAQALLDGLAGKADTEGYEADGNIMVSELAKYMRKNVGELARANGKTEEQKKQQAGVLEAQSTDFVVAYNPPARAKSLDRLKKFDALAADKLPKKIAEEGRELLVRMPKLEARQSLRKTYQKLVDGKIDVAGFNADRETILESTRLAESASLKYATVIMNAGNLVRKSYYKDVPKAPLVGHAVEGLYKSIEMKVPSDIQTRLDNVKEMKDPELLRLLMDVRTSLGKREDLDKGQDITNTLNAMLGKLDRHTGYIPPDVVEKFKTDTAGSFRGIGVQIRRNEARDQLQIVTPIFNSPSHKAGLRAGDVITTIISEVDPLTGRPYDEPKVSPTKGMAIDEAVKLIKGKPGTRIKIMVDREGEKKPIEYTLIRRDIEVESVLGHKRNEKTDTWNYVIDPENKICYVRLTQFSGNTYEELEKVMKQLSKEGIKGFILDLRFNPGGLLDSSIKISDLFIDDGMIVTIRHRDGKETSYVGRTDGSYLTFPMVCLVNGGSASASEIVSGCLQDHGRAVIMGSRSFGKGSVQSLIEFENRTSIVKLTTATYWRPSGRNMNKADTKGRDTDEWGVTPNKGFELKLSKKEEGDLFEHLRDAEIIRAGPAPKSEVGSEFRDRQLDMALEYLRGQIRATARKDVKR